MSSTNSQSNSTNFPADGAEEAEQVIIFTDYSEKSHALTGPFKVKYEKFRVDELRPCREWTFNRKLFAGPGWRIAKDSLKELTDLLEKNNIDYQIHPFDQKIRQDGLDASRQRREEKRLTANPRPPKDPKKFVTLGKSKVSKVKKVPKITSMDDVKSRGLKTLSWFVHNLVLEIPDNWKFNHLESDSDEKTEFGVHHFFHFDTALTFTEVMRKVREKLPDNYYLSLIYHAEEKLLLVSF